MKQLTQANLSDLGDKYTWLAINKYGELHGYEEKPVPCGTVSGYEHQRTAIWLGRDYDATDWENSAIRREEVA